MTYKELKEKIESMPQEWLDKDVRVVGERTPATSAYLGKADQDIFFSLYDDEVFFSNELSSEELEDENAFGLIARKGEYFIFYD